VPVIASKEGLRLAREGEKGIPSLKEGELVVTSGMQLITPGSSVTTVEGKMTADEG
jgi:hypothetical protein